MTIKDRLAKIKERLKTANFDDFEWEYDGQPDNDISFLIEVVEVMYKALEEIGDGISPMGGFITPDGHRRLIANKALAKTESILEGVK